MREWLIGLAAAAGLLAATWALLYLAARRLPPGLLRDLAAFIPDCVTCVRRLRRHPGIPRRAKLAVLLAGLYVASPIDLIPEFLPVIGPLDDIAVAALALRYAARSIPREVLLDAWPGETRILLRLIGSERKRILRTKHCPAPRRIRSVRLMNRKHRLETLAVHAGEPRPAHGGSVVFPVYQGTVYEAGPDNKAGYLRYSNTPTQEYLQGKLAALEGAEAAVATASGMAAIATALHSTLAAGDHVIVAGAVYGGTHALLTDQGPRLGWNVDFVDAADPAAWRQALRPETRAVYTESISNPLVAVGDLAGLARFAAEHGLTSIIDNTFPTPVVFRPHTVGYDLVCHSATKALNGHSDLVAGVVTGSAERIDRLQGFLTLYGGSLDPHAAFLLARGLKTLVLRVRQQNVNAMALAEFLEGHERIAEVRYPGLPAHPDHERAKALFDGFGSVLSFTPVGGIEAAEFLLKALRIPYAAPSLGGVESLVTRPAISSHEKLSPCDRAAAGIAEDLVRFSAGIEATEDLVADFAQALDS